MIRRRAALLAAAGYVAAVALGLVSGHGAEAAFVSALALAVTLAVATALELRPALRERPPQRARDVEMPLRLRQIVDVVHASQRSELAVDRSLRPLLEPIVVARLGRHGVDLTLAPRRAQELLGDVLWQVVRPDRPPATFRVGGGLAEDDLRTVIRRLEQL